MSEMVERVARVLCAADRLDPDEDWRVSGGIMLTVAIECGKAQRWRTYAPKARAAIEAMREPTQAMTDAGIVSNQRILHNCVGIWQEMISAALATSAEPPR